MEAIEAQQSPSQYLPRGRQLWQRFRRESRVEAADAEVDPRTFVAWLKAMRPLLSDSSWRQYRLAGSAAIREMAHPAAEEALTALTGRGAAEAPAVYRATLSRLGGHVSAERAQRFEPGHFRKLMDSLRRLYRSQVVDWLEDFLAAGIATGLLPTEWPRARMETLADGRILLHVADDRALHRTLDVSSFDGATVRTLERMVERSQQWTRDGTAISRRSECAQMLVDASTTLFPRMRTVYSLYSTRHQFVANMKAIMTEAEVAALIGDVEVGSGKGAWPREMIEDVPWPVKEQVEQMRLHLETLKVRRRKRAEAAAVQGEVHGEAESARLARAVAFVRAEFAEAGQAAPESLVATVAAKVCRAMRG